MQELASPSLLFIFVRHGIESTLERSAITREHMGRLLHQLLCAGHQTPRPSSQCPTATHAPARHHAAWSAVPSTLPLTESKPGSPTSLSSRSHTYPISSTGEEQSLLFQTCCCRPHGLSTSLQHPHSQSSVKERQEGDLDSQAAQSHWAALLPRSYSAL